MTSRHRATATLRVVMIVASLLVPACTALRPASPARPAGGDSAAMPGQPAGVDAIAMPARATDLPDLMPTPAPDVVHSTDAGGIAPEYIIILEAYYGDGVLHVTGEASPAFEQGLAVRALDGAGQVLAQGTATIQAEAGQRGPFTADLPAGGGVAMAQVFITSPRDGGITHLASAWVDVQSVPATWQDGEMIRITAPLPGAALSGHVTVTGAAGPTFEQALLVQVYDAGGLLIGQSSGTISAELGQGGSFSIDVACAAQGGGPGRVVVLSDSPRNGAVVHLASVEVAIVP